MRGTRVGIRVTHETWHIVSPEGIFCLGIDRLSLRVLPLFRITDYPPSSPHLIYGHTQESDVPENYLAAISEAIHWEVMREERVKKRGSF